MALFLSAAIAASALLTGCGSAASGSTAASQEVVTFKMVGNNASALSTEAAKKIAALIEEKSNGTLKPELYLEGQLGDNDEDEAFLESFQEKGMTLITKDEIDIESFKEAIIPQLLEENKDVYPEGAYEQIQALNQ